MRQKLFALLLVIAVLLCLGACANNTAKPLTPAQKYLNSTSDEDLFNEFEKACYIGTNGTMGFAKVSDISSDDLYRFANMTVDLDTMNKWYHDADQKYHIPLSDITALLDKYFEKYTFVPNGIKYISYYDEEKKELVATALGGDMGAWNPSLVGKEAIGDNLIKIQFHDEYSPEYKIFITAKVTDTGIGFLSCIFTKQ